MAIIKNVQASRVTGELDIDNIKVGAVALDTENTIESKNVADAITAKVTGAGDAQFKTVNVGGLYTLPLADGTANQIIKTDGAGVLSFADVTVPSHTHSYLPLAGGTLSGTLILPSATINTALTTATDHTQVLTRNPTTGVIESINSTAFVSTSQLARNTAGTGVLFGGKMLIVDTTHISIEAGGGTIAQHLPNGDTTIIDITWDAIASELVPVGTGLGHYVFIDPLGDAMFKVATDPAEPGDIRDNIYLGLVGHSNGTSITALINAPIPAFNVINTVDELAQGIGPFSLDGASIGITGTQALTLTSSSSFQIGANLHNELNLPNIITNVALSSPILNMVKSTAFLGPGTTECPFTQWDNLGTLTTLTNANDAAAHRIWYQPSTNKLYFQYGQVQYNNLTDAINGYSNESFVTPTNLTQNSYLVAVICASRNCVDWTVYSTARYKVILQSKFASKGGGGIGAFDTLQSTYNNSTTPEILTDATRGAVSIKNGQALDTALTLESQNIAGSNTFSVDGNGQILANNLGLSMGVNTPTSKLHIHQGSDANNYIKVTNNDTGAGIGDGLDIGITTTEKAVIWNYENTAMGFATNNTERLIINADGSWTAYNDGTVNSLTLGRGYNSVVGNVALGVSVLAVNNPTGTANTGVGYQALMANTIGYQNAGIGNQVLKINTTGYSNTGIGQGALIANQTGNENTAIGRASLYASTGSSNIGLGYYAGRWAVSSNELYISSYQHINNANEKAHAIIYGTMGATSSVQKLYLNANVVIDNKYTLPLADGTANQVIATDGAGNLSWIAASGTGVSPLESTASRIFLNNNFI